MHQPPVQPDRAVGCAAAPAGARRRQPPARRSPAEPAGVDRQALLEQRARLALQPRLHRVAQLLGVRLGRQPHAQHVAVEPDPGGAGVQAHRQLPPHERHPAAVLPAHREPLAPLGVFAPLDELAQDPVLLVGDRRVDLGQGDPARRGHAQPGVVDIEADRAPPRAAKLVLDRVARELRHAPAPAGRRDARLGRRRRARRRVSRRSRLGARRPHDRRAGRQRGRRVEQRQRQLQRGVARRTREFTESLHAGRVREWCGRRAG